MYIIALILFVVHCSVEVSGLVNFEVPIRLELLKDNIEKTFFYRQK